MTLLMIAIGAAITRCDYQVRSIAIRCQSYELRQREFSHEVIQPVFALTSLSSLSWHWSHCVSF